jgi:subtilisin family serine protease
LRGLSCFGLCLALLSGSPALALDLPVFRPERGERLSAPAYLGDRLELRLRPAAAAASRAAAAAAPASVRLERLGAAGVDRLAQELGGAWFEPEFRGETPPPAGSNEADFTAFYVVHLPEGVDLEPALARFRRLGEVETADPIAVLPVSAVPNDSLWSSSPWFYQPSRRDIHVTEAWDVTTGDTTIVIAILDTGVLSDHPDIGGTVPGGSGQIWTNTAEALGTPGVDDDGNGWVDDVHGWDFVDLADSSQAVACEDWKTPDNDPRDFAGHGTAVAGLAGALSNNGIGATGTAWNVRIMPLRIGWAAPGAPLGLVNMSFVAQAIRYATRGGAHVINCSFATVNESGLYEAASAAVRAGSTIVVAAGNDESPRQPHELADREDVVAVAATDENDQVWYSSNTGDFVDLSAPGHDIVSTFVAHGANCAALPAYSIRLSGTSLAAPMVSGAVALLQARRRALGLPLLPPLDVLQRLRETADDISALNPTRTGYGAGRLNVYRLLTDPPGSSTLRIGGRTVGPAVMLPTASGQNDVAYVTTNNKLLLLEGRGDTGSAFTLPTRPLSGLAAADVTAGGRIGMFASITGGQVGGFDDTGTPLPGWPARTGSARIKLTAPALGDIDGDGAIEIVCGGDDGNVWAWNVDTTRVSGFPAAADGSAIAGPVALSDLDGAPGAEIIATTLAGNVVVLTGHGTPESGWPVRLGTPITSPVVGRLGTDPTPVVFVGAGPRLYALGPDGGLRFSAPLTALSGGTANQDLALGDLDGDGSDEIVVATRAPATLAVFDSAGAMLTARGWPRAMPDTAKGPPVIGQLRGGTGARSAAEIMLFVGNGLLAFTDSAATLGAFPKPGGAGAAPTLVELDRTGSTQVLAGTGPDSVLYVYDAGPGSAEGGSSPWFTPRGNFARTGSRLYAPPLSVPDHLPPVGVTDLAADSIGTAGVRLTWTAPGDDGGIGRASAYDLRRATFRLDLTSFGSGDSLGDAPEPARSGRGERYLAGGLASDVTYFFALRARDDAGNVSDLSNLLVVTTGRGAPGKVLDLAALSVEDTAVTLRWSGTGDDGPLGRPVSYLVLISLSPIGSPLIDPSETRVVPASAEPGRPETHTVGRLERARRYWLAIVAQDEGGNPSDLSNVVAVQTQVGGPLAGRAGPGIASRVQPSGRPVEFYWQGAVDRGALLQTIRVYDVAGRLLRTLPVGSDAGGVVTWDGRDAGGDLVPAGLYFARLTSGSIHVHTRVVLLP